MKKKEAGSEGDWSLGGDQSYLRALLSLGYSKQLNPVVFALSKTKEREITCPQLTTEASVKGGSVL